MEAPNHDKKFIFRFLEQYFHTANVMIFHISTMTEIIDIHILQQ